LIDCVLADKEGIGAGKDFIKYCGNYLYVLGGGCRIYIYSLL